MKYKTGFWYQVISAVLFLGMALYLWAAPSALGNIGRSYRQIFVVVLVLWGLFRAANAWFMWKRNKQHRER